MELNKFLMEDILKLDGDSLEWWMRRKDEYPFLAAVARRVLAIPATSADAEWLFSIAGLMHTAKRNRLTGDHITLLVSLRMAWKPIEAYFADKNYKKK